MEIEDVEKILLKKPEKKLSQLEKEYLERHYRENVKKAALIQMDAFKQATSNPKYDVEFDYDDEASERVASTAQLCIAANLIRLNETLEKILNKMEQKDE